MIYQLKISVNGVKRPPVWRRVQVPSTTSFDSMHNVIQAAFGWGNSQSYLFFGGGYRYTLTRDDDPDFSKHDSRYYSLRDHYRWGDKKLRYTYGPSNEWLLDIVLEKKIDFYRDFATCTGGNGACPPYDCGGAAAYEDLKAAGKAGNPTAFSLEEAGRTVRAVPCLRTIKENYNRWKMNPGDWMGRMPYTNATDTDTYYEGIANEVLSILNAYSKDFMNERLHNNETNGDDYPAMAICLTQWFVDVVAEGGIWRAFTDECKRRYGRLPFYDVAESDHHPGRVNEADVRFMLWNSLQQYNVGEYKMVSMVNPANDYIVEAAAEIYALFCREFDKAPRNTAWHDIFQPKELKEPLLSSFVPYLSKVMNYSFINPRRSLKLVDKKREIYAEYGYQYASLCGPEQDLVAQWVFEDTGDCTLGLTVAEWGTRILRYSAPEAARRLEQMEIVSKRAFFLLSDNGQSYCLEDAANASEPDARYIVDKAELTFRRLEYKAPGETYILTRLARIDGQWKVIPPKETIDQETYDDTPELKDEANKLSRRMKQKAYDTFIEASGGKEFVFFKKKRAAAQFYRKLYGGRGRLPKYVDDNSFMAADPTIGIVPGLSSASWVNSPDNPCYNPESRHWGSVGYLACLTQLPHKIVCRMMELGMVSGDTMCRSDYDESVRRISRDNPQFIIDYFCHGCRDKL